MRMGATRLPRRRVRVPLVRFLSLLLAVLVAVPTVLVLLIGLSTGLRNTQILLAERVRLLRSEMTQRTDEFLAPAETLPRFLGERLAAGDLNPDDTRAVADAIRYAYAAASQLAAVAFAHPSGWYAVSFRRPDGELGSEVRGWRDDPVVSGILDGLETRGSTPHWAQPLFSAKAETTLVTYVQPVWRQGLYVGAIMAIIRVDELSRFIQGLGRDLNENLFILHGRDHVLAHSAIARGDVPLTRDRPLPARVAVGDPVLAQFWQPGWSSRHPAGADGPGHMLDVGGHTYIALYERLPVTGDQPWIVGGYVSRNLAEAEFYRLLVGGLIGLGAALLAVLAAVVVGRRLARPVEELAAASAAISRLDLDRVEAVHPSRVREVDEAGRAFNAMLGTLRLFRRYVPHKLVRTLMAIGDGAELASEERIVTVMFTDIVGFTAAAEGMSAADCARLLNEHFGLLVAQVEATGGTVDKLMGDALMAFWGAPEDQPDHAARAVAAALGMRAAVSAENRAAAMPLRLRVGLHTGRVVVGNIGAAQRLAYTVVGDTVNVANRLERLARVLAADDEVAILISAETAGAAGSGLRLVPKGRHRVRGRSAPITVYGLDDEAAAASRQAGPLAAVPP